MQDSCCPQVGFELPEHTYVGKTITQLHNIHSLFLHCCQNPSCVQIATSFPHDSRRKDRIPRPRNRSIPACLGPGEACTLVDWVTCLPPDSSPLFPFPLCLAPSPSLGPTETSYPFFLPSPHSGEARDCSGCHSSQVCTCIWLRAQTRGWKAR